MALFVSPRQTTPVKVVKSCLHAPDGRVPELLRDLSTVDEFSQFPGAKFGMPGPGLLHLHEPLQAVPAIAGQNRRTILNGRSMSWIKNRWPESLDLIQRIQIVPDAPQILPNPGGIPPAQEKVPNENRFGFGPPDRQMIPAVPWSLHHHQVSLVGRYPVAIRKGMDGNGGTFRRKIARRGKEIGSGSLH